VRHLLKRRRGGFTLVETLVAFAVLAVAMSQLMAALGGAANNESRADFFLRACREGQSQLDALGVTERLIQGETTGSYEDGLLWSLRVEPYVTLQSPINSGSVASFWAHLTIRRPGSREGATQSLTLTTLKIVTTSEPTQ
jgi:general secretion pathway protein I